MATIIAVRMQLQSDTEEAIKQLKRAGFAPEKIASFYVNPPGQHAVYPIGGDRSQSPGDTALGAQLGANVEPLIEAFLSIDKPKERGEIHNAKEDATDTAEPGKNWAAAPKAGHGDVRHDTVALRRAGMLVAVEVPDQTGVNQAVAVFSTLGAQKMEKAQGTIMDGQWRDFDPLSEPEYI